MEDEIIQTEEAPEEPTEDEQEYRDPYEEWLGTLTPEEQREIESDPPAEKLPRQLEQAKNRLKRLQDRGMAVTVEEARERAQLEEMVPLMEARVQENERAEVFLGVDDQQLAERALENETAALDAQRAHKEAKAAREALLGSLSTPMERRVYEAKVKQSCVSA